MKLHNKHYAAYYPADKGLNLMLAKQRKSTGHPPFALLFFWRWAVPYRLVVSKNFAKFNKSFFRQHVFKKVLKIKRLEKEKCTFCCNMQPQKSNCVLLKVTLCAALFKISTSQNSYSDVVHDFQQVVFHTQVRCLFFMIFESLLFEV